MGSGDADAPEKELSGQWRGYFGLFQSPCKTPCSLLTPGSLWAVGSCKGQCALGEADAFSLLGIYLRLLTRKPQALGNAYPPLPSPPLPAMASVDLRLRNQNPAKDAEKG